MPKRNGGKLHAVTVTFSWPHIKGSKPRVYKMKVRDLHEAEDKALDLFAKDKRPLPYRQLEDFATKYESKTLSIGFAYDVRRQTIQRNGDDWLHIGAPVQNPNDVDWIGKDLARLLNEDMST